MDIKKTLLWFSASSAAVLAVGARAYKYFYTQESRIESQLANRLLTQTLQDAYRITNQPSSAAVVSAFSYAGLSVLNAYVSHQQQRSAQPIVAPQPVGNLPVLNANNFEQRLTDCGYDLNNVPEEFCCPISYQIMEEPVTAYTSYQNNSGQTIKTPHTYDKSSYNQFRGICPENRLPFISREDNVELKNRIEAFVSQAEHNAARARI